MLAVQCPGGCAEDRVTVGRTRGVRTPDGESPRGVGVAGALLPQAELGFIYSPLQYDSVLRRSGVTLQDLFAEVNHIATDLIDSSEK